MKILKYALVLIILIGAFVFYILQSTGFFRTIEYRFAGEFSEKIKVVGAEDMQVDYESGFLLISSDDRASRRDGDPKPGALYKIDLSDGSLTPLKLPRTNQGRFYPHGISMRKLSDSIHRVWVVNHVGMAHSIEVFDLKGDTLHHLKTLRDPSMISPNDVVALDEERFYYTNDHGHVKGFRKVLEDYLGLKASNVGYYDGTKFREVADGIAYANGINFDASRNILFVASPRGFMVKVYKVQDSGDLQFVESIDCNTGVDNIEFDQDGQIWIGSHPSLLHFSMYAGGKKEISPSEIITIDYRAKGDYTLKSVYLEDGSAMSGATVAVPYDDMIFVGNVMDAHFLVLETK